jgi:hypothetical protein
METGKKKATFNINETTHQGLKLAAVVRRREMVELLEEALGAYLGWNKMTRIEKDEIAVDRIAEFQGQGQKSTVAFFDLCKQLGYAGGESKVVEQLLAHLHATGLLIVEVNDNRTGYKNLAHYDEGSAAIQSYGHLRLQLTIPGRLRFQQLIAREEWEKNNLQGAA